MVDVDRVASRGFDQGEEVLLKPAPQYQCHHCPRADQRKGCAGKHPKGPPSRWLGDKAANNQGRNAMERILPAPLQPRQPTPQDELHLQWGQLGGASEEDFPKEIVSPPQLARKLVDPGDSHDWKLL